MGPECGACTDACPVEDALEWEDGIKPVVNGERCTGCALCREACILDPKAIKVSLDGELHDRLTEAAQERGTSVGALVREAIAKHLPKRQRRRRKQ